MRDVRRELNSRVVQTRFKEKVWLHKYAAMMVCHKWGHVPPNQALACLIHTLQTKKRLAYMAASSVLVSQETCLSWE